MTNTRATTMCWAVTLLAAAQVLPGAEIVALRGDVSPVHDPALIKANGVYYVFSTGGSIRRSRDLHEWERCGRVFEHLPDWVGHELSGVKGGYWAPDISFYQAQYRLYYAVSTFGNNDSVIGLATNKTLDPDSPDYNWTDRGMVLRSHRSDDFNAIDPNLVADENGRQWLVFGSFWGGIKMRRIDPDTGMLAREDSKLYSLATRPITHAIEAPYIVRHDSFYYLFASFDFCCRAQNSTYYVVVGRSRYVTGPYVDRDGRPMVGGGGTPVTHGTSLWRGPGHEAVLLQRGGPDLLAFHAYDAATGKPWLQISTVDWNSGWPSVAPLPGRPE